MVLFEDVKGFIENGHIVKLRLGRGARTDVDWEEPKESAICVVKAKGQIIFITPKEESWSDYSPQYDYCGNNLFVNEDYYMEVLDWKIS